VDTDESSEAVNWQAPEQRSEHSEHISAAVATHHREPVWLTALDHSTPTFQISKIWTRSNDSCQFHSQGTVAQFFNSLVVEVEFQG